MIETCFDIAHTFLLHRTGHCNTTCELRISTSLTAPERLIAVSLSTALVCETRPPAYKMTVSTSDNFCSSWCQLRPTHPSSKCRASTLPLHHRSLPSLTADVVQSPPAQVLSVRLGHTLDLSALRPSYSKVQILDAISPRPPRRFLSNC